MAAVKRGKNDEVIISLVPEIKRMAIRMKNRIYSSYTVDDLFGTALLAVVESASTIDDSDPEKFRHYLLKRAKGSMYDELRKEDFLSRSTRDFLSTYELAFSKLYESTGVRPTTHEIAEELEMDEAELLDELRKSETSSFYSIEDWFKGNDGESSFEDTVAGESDNGETKLGELDMQTELLKGLDKIPFQERLVLSFHYYDGLNFKEIAMVLNITPGRVSQIHTKALQLLKHIVANPGII